LRVQSVNIDALDLDKFERNDDEGLGGSGNDRKFRDAYGPLSAVFSSYPAAQPVKMESCWFILFSPESSRNVLPQKSFAALERDQLQNATANEPWHAQFGRTFGGFKQERRNKT